MNVWKKQTCAQGRRQGTSPGSLVSRPSRADSELNKFEEVTATAPKAAVLHVS